MRYFWHFNILLVLYFSCQKKTIATIPEVETPEFILIDSIQSILTWVVGDRKSIWDGTMPIKGQLQLRGDTLICVNLTLSITELQIQTKISTQEKIMLKQRWLNETGFDIDSLPDVKLIIPSNPQTPKDGRDQLEKKKIFNLSTGKILIKNDSTDIKMELSLLDANKQELSIRFKLDNKNWSYAKKIDINSSEWFIDVRIFLKPKNKYILKIMTL